MFVFMGVRLPSTDDDDYKEFVHVPSKKTKLASPHIVIPKEVLANKEVVIAATRCNITPTQSSRMLKAFISASKGHASAVYKISAYARKHSKIALGAIREEVKHDRTPPYRCVLHFDGKYMKTIGRTGVKE